MLVNYVQETILCVFISETIFVCYFQFISYFSTMKLKQTNDLEAMMEVGTKELICLSIFKNQQRALRTVQYLNMVVNGYYHVLPRT
jgi:hypothetical protein